LQVEICKLSKGLRVNSVLNSVMLSVRYQPHISTLLLCIHINGQQADLAINSYGTTLLGQIYYGTEYSEIGVFFIALKYAN